MAFENRDFTGNQKNAGGVVLASKPYSIDVVKVKKDDKDKIIAGNVAYADSDGYVSDNSNSGSVVGVFVRNTIGLGQEDIDEDILTEVCTTGYVFVNLKTGETQPSYGAIAEIDGDKFKKGSAFRNGIFAGVAGQDNADGTAVTLVRLKV